MQLAIDIGNTRAKLVLFEKGQIIARYQLEELTVKDLSDIYTKYPFEATIMSSVAKEQTEVEEWLDVQGLFIKLNYLTPIPIQNAYQTPQTLGNDRLAAAVGAFALYPNQNCLVVDAGTCITYEFLSEQGEYKGGSIAPGMEMRFKAMHHFTAKLPLVKKQRLETWIGFNTETSMRTGGQLGTVLEIEGFAQRYEREFGQVQLILTGGDAEFLAEHLTIKNYIINKDIVLIGLHKILEYNANLLE